MTTKKGWIDFQNEVAERNEYHYSDEDFESSEENVIRIIYSEELVFNPVIKRISIIDKSKDLKTLIIDIYNQIFLDWDAPIVFAIDEEGCELLGNCNDEVIVQIDEEMLQRMFSQELLDEFRRQVKTQKEKNRYK
jgi:hypothetical protein